MKIMGTTFDSAGFEKAKAERWEYRGNNHRYCKKHTTIFLYSGDNEESEPCWSCYSEFTREGGGKDESQEEAR